MVRDSHAMGVSSQVAENVFWAAEGGLGIDHPVVGEQSPQETAKGIRSSDLLQRAVELELVAPEKLSESLCELPAEYATERDDWQEEAVRAVYPLRSVRSQSTDGNDVMDMRMMLQVLAPGV